MVASVLNTPRAIEVSVYVRAFVKLREMLGTHKQLARKLSIYFGGHKSAGSAPCSRPLLQLGRGSCQLREAFSLPAEARYLERRKAQGSQTTIQQALVDVHIVRQQLPKDAPKVTQIATLVKAFQQTDAPENFEPVLLRQLARPVIVEQHRFRTQLFRQQDCAHLAGT